MGPIYFDYNATTPVNPRVLEAMLPYFWEQFGNPSSSHTYGLVARAAIEQARGQVAALLGCAPEEIVFTGAGSEADNLAIKGIAEANQHGDHLITAQIEHPAVLATCRYLERRRFRVTYLPVDRYGRVELGGRAAGDHPAHDLDHHHACEQRDGHATAARSHR